MIIRRTPSTVIPRVGHQHRIICIARLGIRGGICFDQFDHLPPGQVPLGISLVAYAVDI